MNSLKSFVTGFFLWGILEGISAQNIHTKSKSNATAQQDGVQLSFFQLDDPVLVQIRDQIKGLDINALTPIEALNKLNEIKKITGL